MWLVIRTSDGKVRRQTQHHVDDSSVQFRQAIDDHKHDGCMLKRMTEHVWKCITVSGVETTISLEPDSPGRRQPRYKS